MAAYSRPFPFAALAPRFVMPPINQSAQLPVSLYGLSRSVYTRIARLALEEKGVPYTLEEVEIFGPGGVPAAHFERHPFGRIPVLRHGEFSVFETAAITRYVDEAFDGPPLQPAGPRSRARMTQIIGLLDSYAYRPMVWGVFVQRMSVPLEGGSPDEAEITRSLEAAGAVLNVLEGMLGAHAFLAGPTLTLADLHAFPMLLYLTFAPEGAALVERHRGVAGWLAALQSRASVLGTRSRRELS
jgi:glutathione S-transferase